MRHCHAGEGRGCQPACRHPFGAAEGKQHPSQGCTLTPILNKAEVGVSPPRSPTGPGMQCNVVTFFSVNLMTQLMTFTSRPCCMLYSTDLGLCVCLGTMCCHMPQSAVDGFEACLPKISTKSEWSPLPVLLPSCSSVVKTHEQHDCCLLPGLA